MTDKMTTPHLDDDSIVEVIGMGSIVVEVIVKDKTKKL